MELVQTSAQSGVVDEDVHRLPFRRKRGEGALDGGLIADIKPEAMRFCAELSLEVYSQLFQAVQSPGRHKDPGALAGEGTSTGPADPRARPGDKDDLIAKRSHGQPPRISLYKNFDKKTGIFVVKFF
jgi:hypothetical protein